MQKLNEEKNENYDQELSIYEAKCIDRVGHHYQVVGLRLLMVDRASKTQI